MSYDVVIVHPRLRHSGGVSTDVAALEAGLRSKDVPVRVVTRLPRVLPRRTIVHLFGCLPSASAAASFVSARARRLPVVWTPIFHPSRAGTWHGYRLLRAMQLFDTVAPRIARWTSAVVAETRDEADYFGSVGAPRSLVIPPTVGPDRVVQTDEVAAFRARHDLDDSPFVLTVANTSRRKGLSFALAVVRELRAQRPEVELVVAGVERPAQPGVTFLGWVDPEELAVAYAASFVVLVPSFYESFGRSVIEGWQHGRPVAVTDRVALSSVVRAERAGVVVPFGDAATAANAIAALLADEARATALGAAGRAVVERDYLPGDALDRTIELYDEVAAECFT